MDPALRKQVLRMISYGLYVVTARHESRIAAATVDWVTQASFEPPMVVCCLRQDSLIYELVRAAGRFAVHPLGENQKSFAAHFFKNKSATETEINGQPCTIADSGVPILSGAPAYFVLETVGQLTQSDHAVVLGRVIGVGLNTNPPPPPLLMRDTGWHYGG
jgi:flavin reductase (DIM6/NTAB) family NADH-FMN oxidoreductase RutF